MREGIVQCGHFAARGASSDADVRTFWSKNLRIFEILVCPHGQVGGGLSQCGHFADKGVNFSRFCADVFYGRPLSKATLIWSSNEVAA